MDSNFLFSGFSYPWFGTYYGFTEFQGSRRFSTYVEGTISKMKQSLLKVLHGICREHSKRSIGIQNCQDPWLPHFPNLSNLLRFLKSACAILRSHVGISQIGCHSHYPYPKNLLIMQICKKWSLFNHFLPFNYFDYSLSKKIGYFWLAILKYSKIVK